MKKFLLPVLLFLSLGINALAAYQLAHLPQAINKTVTYQVNKIGQDGKTPIKGLDYFDGKTLPAIQPKNGTNGASGAVGKNGKDAEPAKPCTTYNEENGDLVILCPDGTRSVLRQPVNGTDGYSPTIQCNTITGKLRVQYNPEYAFQDIPNSKCVV